MIEVVVVGHGLAGRHFHCPLIRRQGELRLRGVVARRPEARAEAEALWGVIGYSDLETALADPQVDLVVLATPHNVHADQTVAVLEAGKHCVVDKVMALSEGEAERMIASRDASGRMLSVFHNRRWDWDYLTVMDVLARGAIGRPWLIESGVCRFRPPRTWRGRAEEAGTILHDWGAHLVDQAFGLGLGVCWRLHAWIAPAPWEGVDIGGHGRIEMDFGGARVVVETSRICPLERPRWSMLGTAGWYIKYGLDPQEEALRSGDLDRADERPEDRGRLQLETGEGIKEAPIETIRGSWDAYYGNIADHLLRGAPLAVTAEQGREVVRLLDAAGRSARDGQVVEGAWGVTGPGDGSAASASL